MTIEEAIKRAEDTAIGADDLCKRYDRASGYSRSHDETIRTNDAKMFEKSAREHRQLAEWLKDYKRLLESGSEKPNKSEIPTGSDDCISRQDVLSEIIRFSTEEGASVECQQLYCDVNNMPPVTPATPAQRWIPVSERLPEEGEWVMVTFGGKIAVCLAQDNDGALREVTSLISKNATEIWLYPEPEWGDGYAVWMPLPQPYRAKGEKYE